MSDFLDLIKNTLQETVASTNTVFIMRGISGCGKSTYTKSHFPNATVVSADHFFERTGTYKFDAKQLPTAHAECLHKFTQAIQHGDHQIVVDNTATKVWEFKNYVDLAKQHNYQVEVIRLVCDPAIAAARNAHGVPLETVKKMAARFENYPSEQVIHKT